MNLAAPVKIFTVMVCLPVCTAAMMAEPTRPAARAAGTGLFAGQSTAGGRAEHTAARAHATAKAATGRDAADSARKTAGAAKTAQVKTAADHAAASRTAAKAAQSRTAAGSAASRTAAAHARRVAADAARDARVHAREETQQRAAAQVAALAAIKAADETMGRAMRTGEASADPVLWTAKAVSPKDASEPAGGAVTAGGAASKDHAAGWTGDAAGGTAGAQSGAATGRTDGTVVPANAGTDGAGAASSSGRSLDLRATVTLLPSLYNRRGSLVVPAPLFGSREILLHQNEMAEGEGIDRVRDKADLATMRREKKLVALPENETVHIDERLPEDRRYARPWAANFVTAFARDYYAVFHEPLQVNSAVRTVAFQKHLERVNGNAAAATGDAASPHLTGEAVDIAKHGLTLAQIAWMRAYLQPLIEQGKIDVEEEFQQACFHISVYERYLPGAGPRFNYAASRQSAGLP